MHTKYHLIQICYIKYKKPEEHIYLTNKEKLLLTKISCVTLCLMNTFNLYANNIDRKITMVETKVDNTGEMLIRILQLAIYWSSMFFALTEILKTIKKQDIAGITAIIFKYGLIMTIGYGMPSIWRFIKELFIE